MLMSVLMNDAAEKLEPPDKEMVMRGKLAHLLYADDTLLLGVSEESVQRFLTVVAEEGASYGLQLHWGKLQQMNVRCEAHLRRPDGTDIEPQEQMTYLGSIISSDGRVHRELVKRLGLAQSTFRELARLWRHSSLGRQKKLRLFNALVVPRAMYGLEAAWLSKPERRRLDGFQNRCLRQLWGIPPAYISRVSNEKVRILTGERPLSQLLERRQLLLYGKVARAPDDSILRKCTFAPGTLTSINDTFVRKLGRPRAEWTREVGAIALRASGSFANLKRSIVQESTWRNVINDYSQPQGR
jgi:hypothetical protein